MPVSRQPPETPLARPDFPGSARRKVNETSHPGGVLGPFRVLSPKPSAGWWPKRLPIG